LAIQDLPFLFNDQTIKLVERGIDQGDGSVECRDGVRLVLPAEALSADPMPLLIEESEQ